MLQLVRKSRSRLRSHSNTGHLSDWNVQKTSFELSIGKETNYEHDTSSVLHPCCTEQTVLGRNPLKSMVLSVIDDNIVLARVFHRNGARTKHKSLCL
ncbi:protein of unknown function [Bradyrhizobium vignae]|uniref:Uncharacterized protein n=1 Tax=Bradyrhizobium vignae TaxID=1549949 RepID=A0A2U3PRP5_9BRAD|nr:protein of unknown function [Bradyrhizobium vignae]